MSHKKTKPQPPAPLTAPVSAVPPVSCECFSTKTRRLWLWTLCALFLARAVSWGLSELWYDEVLSLNLFVMRPDSLFAVFRDYRIANNHFLANAIQWCWCRIYPVAPDGELFLRLPSILYGLGTLLAVAFCWRKWLGEKFALVTAFLLAASPVFVAFACQMRGYSLAMLLATLAVTAAMRRRDAPTIANAFGLFISSLALPLVMPSAAMLPMGLAASAALPWILREKDADFQRVIQHVWPAVAGAFLGVAYYLTLWEQFQRARAESGGWESACLVGAHLVLAFGLHLALYAWPLAKRCLKDTAVRALLFGVIAAIAAVLLVPSPVGRAPFPRVFLPLLPMLTLAGALAAKNFPRLAAMPLKQLISLAILPGLFLGVAMDFLNGYLLDNSDTPPQNLLVQYYRGQSPNRLWTAAIAGRAASPLEITSSDVFLVNPTDEPAFQFYRQFVTQDKEKQFAAFPSRVNLKETALRDYDSLLVVYARNEHEARGILEFQGIPKDTFLVSSERMGHRQLFRIVP